MTADKLLFRKTAGKKGRFVSITPENSPLKLLSYGRIILEGNLNQVAAESGNQEVALICIKGEGQVTVESQSYSLKPYDSIYIPPGKMFEVSTEKDVDFVECSAPSEKDAGVQFVSFESIKGDSKLHIQSGKETYSRDVYRLIDENVDASRLICGLTFSKPGNWTSWAPHEHAATKEEIYLYIDMPRPGFGIQMMYNQLEKLDFLESVFEDDAVVITSGYHPNVAAPGYGMNFVWMMAALRPEIDRDWTQMNFQEEFAGKY